MKNEISQFVKRLSNLRALLECGAIDQETYDGKKKECQEEFLRWTFTNPKADE